MFNMKNAIKPIEVNVDTKNFDVQFVTDKDGTTVDVKSKVNWIGKVVSWFLTRKARRAAKKAKK